MNGVAKYRDLWVEKNYLKSFCASMINRFGDSIDALAFAWMVYEITGDRAWSAIIFGFNTLPSILFMPLAGVIVERFDKRKVMIMADLGRAALVSLIAALYMTGLVQPWMLAASTFLMSTLEAMRIPAGLGLYPQIVPREKYTVATSFSQASSSLFVILGTGAFGPVIYFFGLQGALFVNAATFALSALLICRIRLPKQARVENKLTVGSFFTDLKGGFSYLYTKKLIFLICVAGSFLGVLSAPQNSMMTPYVRESLGQGEWALTLINIAAMAGLTVGTVLFPSVSARVSKVKLFIAGGVFASASYLVCVAASYIPHVGLLLAILGVSMFLTGLGSAFISVVVNVAFMEQIEAGYLGRVGGIFNAMALSLTPIASFAIAGVAVWATVNQIFAVCGIVSCAFFFILGRNKTFRTIDNPPVTAAKEECLNEGDSTQGSAAPCGGALGD